MAGLHEMSRKEERKFWETQSSADYWDDMEPVELTTGPRPDNRCDTCGDVMLSRYVDVELAGGRVVLRGVRQLYCRQGHETRLSPEAKRVVDAIEAVLRLALNVIGAEHRFEMAA
jgi:hypothetical protein